MGHKRVSTDERAQLVTIHILKGPNWTLGRSGPIGSCAIRAQLVPGPFGPNWFLGLSGPFGPWAVRAQLDPGPFRPNWSLGCSGPIGPWAVRAELVPGPLGAIHWACPWSGGSGHVPGPGAVGMSLLQEQLACPWSRLGPLKVQVGPVRGPGWAPSEVQVLKNVWNQK